MAIAPTGTIYKALSFDNTSSRNYGVYITGEAVYNAPERDVEMITIPGRNGSFALDNGRFQNITVSYPAGIFADNESDFAQAISDFRNFLCSKRGYCRLSDEYNPNEYRMAVYKSGLEVDPAMLKAGEFEIVFECKPQRFLTSGETKQTVANNGTLTNPTLFPSSPLLEVKGYGDLTVNGYEITLQDTTFGDIRVAKQTNNYYSVSSSFVMTATIERDLVETGDAIRLENMTLSDAGVRYVGSVNDAVSYLLNSNYSYTYSDVTLISSNMAYAKHTGVYGYNAHKTTVYLNAAYFTTGTASSVTGSITTQVPTKNSSNTVVETAQFKSDFTLAYDGNDTITLTVTRTITNDTLGLWSIVNIDSSANQTRISSIYANSTASLLGDPTYIDCDLGEAYSIENGTLIPLNSYIDLGSNLPVLDSGSNTFTFDNTITQVKVTPRWWKV